MNESISKALKNWIPFKLFDEGGGNCCRWLYLGDEKISEPFFEETIAKCWQLDENSRPFGCTSNIEVLPEWAQQIESVAPAAFIFHISRCGSTLISQLLSLNTENVVLSEVPFFDELLRSGHKKHDTAGTLPILKAAVDIYGTKRAKINKRLFVKTDSWHIHFYKEFRILYPDTPFIFLYRRPDEVMRSHQKRRGMQAVPGLLEPEIFGLDKQAIMQQGLDGYMAKVLESYFEAFIKILQADELSLPVNYDEGAINIVRKIASFAGAPINKSEIEKMHKRSNFHGKYPGEVFAESMLQDPIPPYLENAFCLYNAIEKIRRMRSL